MTRPITPRDFYEADGVDDWRLLGAGASTFFRTGSFAAGGPLAQAVARLSDELGRHPDLDLRATGVAIRLPPMGTFPLTDRDLELARRISAAARGLGLESDPAMIQDVDLTIDALVTSEVRPFWRAALGFGEVGDDDLVDPRGISPTIWFQPMSEPRTERNRIHVDVFVPDDQAEARVAAVIAAGGRLVSDHAPTWWTLADSEGNEVDIATWLGRD